VERNAPVASSDEIDLYVRTYTSLLRSSGPVRVRAFEEANLDALVALFHEDMRTTMPPAPTWVAGRAANERFYRLMFGSIVPGQFRHLRIGANGQPALAFYRPASPGAPHTLAAIQLVATRDGAISSPSP